MAEVLKREGCEVKVLTGFPNYPTGIIQDGYQGLSKMTETINNIQIDRTWIYPATGRGKFKRLMNYISFTLSSTPKLIFSKWKPDIVFVEAQPIILAFPAYLNYKFRRIPYIYNTLTFKLSMPNKINGYQLIF